MANDTVFSCPGCGTPSAQTVEPYLDIHSGATYTCDNCGEKIVFEAFRVGEYTDYANGFARVRRTARAEALTEAIILFVRDGHAMRVRELLREAEQASAGGEGEVETALERTEKDQERLARRLRELD